MSKVIKQLERKGNCGLNQMIALGLFFCTNDTLEKEVIVLEKKTVPPVDLEMTVARNAATRSFTSPYSLMGLGNDMFDNDLRDIFSTNLDRSLTRTIYVDNRSDPSNKLNLHNWTTLVVEKTDYEWFSAVRDPSSSPDVDHGDSLFINARQRALFPRMRR